MAARLFNFSLRPARLFRAIITICIVSTTYVFLSLFTEGSDRNDAAGDELFERNIPQSCRCRDENSSSLHNFCYGLPRKFGIPGLGKRFSCEWLPIIKKLGLLDPKSAYFRFGRDSLRTSPPFVSAASESHFYAEMTFIKTVQKFLPSKDQRIIVYDLGLSTANIEQIKRLCNVELRSFKFDQYPPWVGWLIDYRWKPLVIAEALKEFGAIWYMDSSVQLEKSNLSHVYSLLTCRTNRYNDPVQRGTLGPTLVPADQIESGFHVDLWLESIRRCDKFAYMLQGYTGHGIFSATHPDIYAYFPTNEDRIKRPTCKMYEAGHVFMVRTVEVVRDVLKWYVLCALEKDCMAPASANLGCSFAPDRFGVYANCHRYDQSVVNLLLANRNNFDSYYWTSGIVDFFHIVRGGDVLTGDVVLRECAFSVT